VRGPYGGQPSQPPSYEEADPGYGRYGTPGPSSPGRPGGRSPQRGEPWPQWGGAPAPEPYQQPYPPRRPPPQVPPYPQDPRGVPYPYGTQDPYGVLGPYGPYSVPGQYGPYDSEPVPSPRPRNWLGQVVVALVVFAVLVVFALIRFAPAATTQPTTAPATVASPAQGTPAAGFHAYTNTAVGVQFNVPDGWTTQNQTTSFGPLVQATSPDGTAALGVGSIPIPSGGNVNEVAAANGAMAGAADSGSVDNKEGPSQVPFGGATWVREAADLTRSGTRLHFVVYVATHGTRVYILDFAATIATFAATDARYFQPTIQSFRFLS
jgi:hypothetical protein